MERKTTYTFTEEEEAVLAEALAMYAGYTREMNVNMLIGDESDAAAVVSEHNTADRLWREFFEIANEQSLEEAKMQFQAIHERPMDVNDLSAFDWFDYVRGDE